MEAHKKDEFTEAITPHIQPLKIGIKNIVEFVNKYSEYEIEDSEKISRIIELVMKEEGYGIVTRKIVKTVLMGFLADYLGENEYAQIRQLKRASQHLRDSE